jgi:hypothetical protein
MILRFVETLKEGKTFRTRAWGYIDPELDSSDSFFDCRIVTWYANTAPSGNRIDRQTRQVDWSKATIERVDGEFPEWIEQRMADWLW